MGKQKDCCMNTKKQKVALTDLHWLYLVICFTIAFQKGQTSVSGCFFTKPQIRTLTKHIHILNLLLFSLCSATSLGSRMKRFTGLGGVRWCHRFICHRKGDRIVCDSLKPSISPCYSKHVNTKAKKSLHIILLLIHLVAFINVNTCLL